MPILASIEVNAAKTAESTANKNHINCRLLFIGSILIIQPIIMHPPLKGNGKNIIHPALAFVLLHEEFTAKSLIGCVLIGAGTLVMVL